MPGMFTNFFVVIILSIYNTNSQDASGLTKCGEQTISQCIAQTKYPDDPYNDDGTNKGYYCNDDITTSCGLTCSSQFACRYLTRFCGTSNQDCVINCLGQYSCHKMNVFCQINHECIIKLSKEFNFRGNSEQPNSYTSGIIHCPATNHKCEIQTNDGQYQLEYATIFGGTSSPLSIIPSSSGMGTGKSFLRNAKIHCPDDASCTIDLRNNDYVGQFLVVDNIGTSFKTTEKADLLVLVATTSASQSNVLGGTSGKFAQVKCPSNAACDINLGKSKYAGRYLKVDGNQNSRLDVKAAAGSSGADQILEFAEITCPISGSCTITCGTGTYSCRHLKIIQQTTNQKQTASLKILLADPSTGPSSGNEVLRRAIIKCPNSAPCLVESGLGQYAGGYSGQGFWDFTCPNAPHSCIVRRKFIQPTPNEFMKNCDKINWGKEHTSNKDFAYCDGRKCPNDCYGCYQNNINKCNPISDQAYDTSAKCETGDNFVWCGPPTCNYNPSTKTHQYLDVEQHLCVDVCPQSYNNQFHIKTDGQRVCGGTCSDSNGCVEEQCKVSACTTLGCCKAGTIGSSDCKESFTLGVGSQLDLNGCGNGLDTYGYPSSSSLQRTICCKDSSNPHPPEPTPQPPAPEPESPAPSSTAVPDGITDDEGKTESSAYLRLTRRGELKQCQQMNEGDTIGCSISIVVRDDNLESKSSTENQQINCTTLDLQMIELPTFDGVPRSQTNQDASYHIMLPPPLYLRLLAPYVKHNNLLTTTERSIVCILLENNIEIDKIETTFLINNVLIPRIGSVKKAQMNDTTIHSQQTLPIFNGRNLVRNGRKKNSQFLEIITSSKKYLEIKSLSSYSDPTISMVSLYANSKVKEIALIRHAWNEDKIIVSLPAFDLACNTDGNTNQKVCYWGLKIENAKNVSTMTTARATSTFLGGILSCPSDANNQNNIDLWLNPDDSSQCDILSTGVLATPLSVSPTTGIDTIDMSLTSASYVIKYVSQCQGYLEPGSSECVVLDTASQCAFGFGDACRPCPFGGSCPGGPEVRSFPGFYTIDFELGLVEKCLPPSIERCLGYNPERMNETLCGDGYVDYKCERCLLGWYLNVDNSCQQCDDNTGIQTNELWKAIIPFSLFVFVTMAIMLSIIYYLERTAKYHQQEMEARKHTEHHTNAKTFDKRATTCERTVRHTREFGIWFMLSAQVMASASSSPAPGLPNWIMNLYASVSFFNLDTSYVVHPDCAPDNTASPSMILVCILLLVLFQIVLFVCASLVPKTYKMFYAAGQGWVFVGMSFVYPVIAKITMKSLHCKTNQFNVLMFDHNSICWEGSHLRLGILAVLTLIIYLIGFPFITFVYLHCIIIQHKFYQKRTKARLARWEHFIDDDYEPQYFYFRHIYWFVSLLLFIIYEYVPIGWGRCCSVILLFSFYLWLLYKYQPFARTERWKLYVRTSLVTVSVFVAILDVAQYWKDHIGQDDMLSLDDEGSDGDTDLISPSSSSSSLSFVSNTSSNAFVIGLSYVLAISCVLVMIILPGSFFIVNYGYRCVGCCGATLDDDGIEKENHNDTEDDADDEERPEEKSSIDIELSSTAVPFEIERKKEKDMKDDSNVIHIDPASGKKYSVDKVTGKSKWLDEQVDVQVDVKVRNPITIFQNKEKNTTKLKIKGKVKKITTLCETKKHDTKWAKIDGKYQVKSAKLKQKVTVLTEQVDVEEGGDWQRHWNEDHKLHYWFNEKTQESKWEEH